MSKPKYKHVLSCHNQAFANLTAAALNTAFGGNSCRVHYTGTAWFIQTTRSDDHNMTFYAYGYYQALEDFQNDS